MLQSISKLRITYTMYIVFYTSMIYLYLLFVYYVSVMKLYNLYELKPRTDLI